MVEAPHELAQWIAAMPRRVRRRGRSWPKIVGIWIVLGPIVLLGIAAIGAILVAAAWAAIGVDRQGQITSASVVHLTKLGVVYDLRYRCTVHGRPLEDVAEADQDVYEAYEKSLKGDGPAPMLRVRTLGIPPMMYAHVVPAGESPWEHVAGIGAAALILIALGRGAYYIAFQVPARQKALYTRGEAVMGTIIQKTQRTQGKSLAFGLLYEFMARDGYRHRYDQHVTRPLWSAAQAPEATLVIYDGDDPERSVLYEYGDFEAVQG